MLLTNAQYPIMTNTSSAPTLTALQAELRHHLVVLAVILNDTYGPHALRSVLRADAATDDDAAAAFDVDRTRLGTLLPQACDYAFHGKLTDDLERELDGGPNYFAIVGDLVAMLEQSELAAELWTDYAGRTEYAPGGLRHLIDVARARIDLDAGDPLDARQLALLAGMTERSVQNAFSLKGAQRLRGTRTAGRFEVAAGEARRWLAERRGFAPTQRIAFDVDETQPPRIASGAELRAYLRELVRRKHGNASVAAARIGMDPDRFARILAGTEPLGLPHARRIAEALVIDESWLLRQVLELDYPDEAALLRKALREP